MIHRIADDQVWPAIPRRHPNNVVLAVPVVCLFLFGCVDASESMDSADNSFETKGGSSRDVARKVSGFREDGAVRAIAFSPDGADLNPGLAIVATGHRNLIAIWNRSLTSVQQTMSLPKGALPRMAISGDSRLLAATAGADISIWELEN
jgi:WD40 repeat protein